MLYIDTHAHINFKAYRDDAKSVIADSLEENTWMILVGSDYKTSNRALDYANKYEKGVYAAVGLHPIHSHPVMEKGENGEEREVAGEEFNYEMYEKLAKFEKVVAVGEIGLDYYHLNPNYNFLENKKFQRDAFLAQLKISALTGKPAIIHCRQAHDDMLAVLKDYKKEFREFLPTGKVWGVMHCFSGDEDLAWKYFSLGLLVSFTGLITFSKQWDELIKKLPLDKFMIETDSPFMTPEPFRGKRNAPYLVKKVARRIAEIKNMSEEAVAAATTENARNLFKI